MYWSVRVSWDTWNAKASSDCTTSPVLTGGGGKFVSISKKTWVNAYLNLGEDDPAVHCFRELGEGLVPDGLVDGELPALLKLLEKFVCQVYSTTGPRSLPALRWELFRPRTWKVKCWLLPGLPCCPTSRGQITLPCVINPIHQTPCTPTNWRQWPEDGEWYVHTS